MKIAHVTVIIDIFVHCCFTDMKTAHFSLDYRSEKLPELKYRVIVWVTMLKEKVQ